MEDLIIEDYESSTSDVVVEEEIKDGKRQICFKGIFSEADKLNGNHRIYPKKVLKEAFDKMMEKSKTSGQPIFGELEHAKDAHVNLKRIAVTFPELVWNEEKGTIEGKAVPTDTPSGKLVEGLAKSGMKICFSTRAAGKLKPYNGPLAEGLAGVSEVMSPLSIISIDVVGTPSCQKAVTDTVYEEKTINEENNKVTFKAVFDSLI